MPKGVHLNPQIEKFWIESGYRIRFTVFKYGKMYQVFWEALKEKELPVPFCYMYSESKPIYYWKNNKYTEDQMLRIIKLKVFI